MIEEYERPQYQKLHQNARVETRREASINEEPVKASTCCGPACWALLALLALAALVLGLLFGLGVIGGTGSNFGGADTANSGVTINGVNYPNGTITI